jgi:hypothetical protein
LKESIFHVGGIAFKFKEKLNLRVVVYGLRKGLRKRFLITMAYIVLNNRIKEVKFKRLYIITMVC